MKFSYIDIFLIAGLGFAGYLGYRGGLVKKLFNLLMLLFSVIIAAKLMTPIGEFFSDAGVLTETEGYIAGFAFVMLAIMVPAILLYHKFGKTGMGKSSSTTFGVILGLVEGAMVISFVLLGMKILDIPDQPTRQGSMLYKPLVNFVPRTFDFLEAYFPGAPEFKQEFKKHFKDIDIFESPSRLGKGT